MKTLVEGFPLQLEEALGIANEFSLAKKRRPDQKLTRLS
jgi:hypothetical protein